MLPYIPKTQKRQEPQITVFKGVNYRSRPLDGEIAAGTNLGSYRYPYLSPRKGRQLVQAMDEPHAAWAGDKLVLVDGGQLIYDGVAIGTVTASPKQFASINSKLVIWPDKKYIDFNTGALKNLQASFTSANDNTVTLSPDSLSITGATVTPSGITSIERAGYPGSPDQRVDDYITVYDSLTGIWDDGAWVIPTGGTLPAGGSEYSAFALYSLEPAYLEETLVGKIVMTRSAASEQINRKRVTTYWPGSPEREYTKTDPYSRPDTDGNYLLITSASKSRQTWGAGCYRDIITIQYTLLNAAGAPMLDRLFAVGDAVKVTGEIEGTPLDVGPAIIRGIAGTVLTFDDGTFPVEQATALDDPVTITRPVPDMDYICASENRLWGVSNEEQGEVYDRETGKMVTVYNRVIHASSLGDPTNFNAYDGLSTDSYSLAIADALDFTGCIGYRGDVLFFKERKIFRIAGDYPAEYAMYVYDVPGISTGSWRSTAIINDVLYYLSREGVQAWAGSENQMISYPLGDGPYLDGVAGTDGTRYWLSARTGVSDWNLHIWDTLHNIWYREDASHALDFCYYNTETHMLTSEGLWRLETDGEVVEWSAELAPADETQNTRNGIVTTMERKNYRWIRLRVEIPEGSTFKVYTAFDDDDAWTQQFPRTEDEWTEDFAEAPFMGTINIPLPPNRVDRIRIKIEGTGDFTLKDVVRAYNVGSLSTR